MVREPQRGRFDGARGAGSPASFREVMRVLFTKRAFWGISFGASASSMMGYGLFFWLPSFFVRSHGMTLVQASVYYGAILLVGGISGIWLGGWLADRFGAARRRAYALIPAIAFIATVPFFIGAVTSTSLVVSFVLFLVPTALGLVWLGPVLSAIQHIVPPGMRATASAIFLFVNNLIGIGLGSVALGALSDVLSARYGTDSLRYAILAGTVFYFVAAGLFLLSAKRLERDWEQLAFPQRQVSAAALRYTGLARLAIDAERAETRRAEGDEALVHAGEVARLAGATRQLVDASGFREGQRERT